MKNARNSARSSIDGVNAIYRDKIYLNSMQKVLMVAFYIFSSFKSLLKRSLFYIVNNFVSSCSLVQPTQQTFFLMKHVSEKNRIASFNIFWLFLIFDIDCRIVDHHCINMQTFFRNISGDEKIQQKY